jgi:hypothetical protein
MYQKHLPKGMGCFLYLKNRADIPFGDEKHTYSSRYNLDLEGKEGDSFSNPSVA